MRVEGLIQCSEVPVDDDDLANKKFVDQAMVTAGIVGSIFATDISPTATGIVGSKVYESNTIPANKVIIEGQTDTPNVRVSFVAEGAAAFYSPVVTVHTVPARVGFPKAATLTEDTYDKRLFNGVVDITGVTEDCTVTLNSSSGAVAVTVVKAAPPGPSMNSVLIGALPGSQTEVKTNDVVAVSAKVQNTATYAEIIQTGASGSAVALTLGAADSGGAGFKTATGNFTVGAGTGAQSVVARARNALGTYGTNVQSTNTVTLNQTAPTIASRVIAYPSTQTALKGSETATITAAVSNADTVAYTATNLTVTNPNTYASVKTVTRNGGTYVTGTPNYTITATKNSNGAVTVATANVSIADAAATATIAIVGTPARLISSVPSGEVYVVQITPNQTLSAAPSLTASSGTWEGSWTLSAGKWSRNLRIVDADIDGAQTFSGLSMNGLANVNGTTITSGASYAVGGFKRRSITFPAFTQYAAIGTAITDFTKVTARYGGTADDLTRRSDTTQFTAGFTIVNSAGAYNPNGTHLFITDAAFAGSNTSGSLTLEIEEVA